MKRQLIIAPALLLLVSVSNVLGAHARREVPPLVIDGVKYIVPNDNGSRGYVRAVDLKTGETLWEKTIYRVRFRIPFPEGDVYWVLIKKMTATEGMLLILSERDKWYTLDPRTRKVKKVSPAEMAKWDLYRETVPPSRMPPSGGYTAKTNVFYTIYAVKPGETIYHVSLYYDVSVERLMQINGLTNTGVSPGLTLRIPPPTKRQE